MLSSNFKKQYLVIIFLVITNLSVFSQNKDSLLIILQEELAREMDALAQEDDPPYFMAFRVTDANQTEISTSSGNLVSFNKNKIRNFFPQIRIGDYTFDNSHEFEEDYSNYNYGGMMGNGFNELPLENNKAAIQHSIWLAVDEAYKNSLQTYNSIKNKERKEDSVNDFSKQNASVYFETPYSSEELKIDDDVIIEKLKSYSKKISEDSTILLAAASIRYYTIRDYFISSEGASIVQNSMLSQLQIVAIIRNEQGNMIPQQISLVGKHPKELLSDEKINKNIDELVSLLAKLKTAKSAEPYAGPAILSPSASGVFFHEIFGHRVEGHRLEKAYDGQTFTDKLGEPVLPKHFSVECNPTIDEFDNKELIGSYVYDDEGIKSERVSLVEDGILKDFLMSRKSTSKSSVSNGHGRGQAGLNPVSRQSNLIITASKTYSDKDLRKLLISECKKQKKEYGYYFKSVVGGFTITDRFNPNVFNIFPSEVYRIYTDGRPDELVVGVELIGTPLTMFSNIICAGDENGIFSGFCGAESGYLPVSAVSPAIFVKKIETQKGMEVKTIVPILPSPSIKK